MLPPPPLKADSASEANFQPLSALGDRCASPILEPERSTLLHEALADSQLQAVRSQLESRGFGMNTEEAQAVQLVGGEQLLIPFGDRAHLVWTRAKGQTAALGLVRQGNKTLNVSADGSERVVRFLPGQKVEKLLRKLREKQKFQQFEGKLSQRGKRLGKVRVLFDETNKLAILGLANEGSEEKVTHQVRIQLKPDRDDEPDGDVWARDGEGGVADREAADSEERGDGSSLAESQHECAVQDSECLADALAGAERAGDGAL